jgi:hypothetical protein
VVSGTTRHVAALNPKAAISKACSEQADAKNLHGNERKKFRAECKRSGGKPSWALCASNVSATWNPILFIEPGVWAGHHLASHKVVLHRTILSIIMIGEAIGMANDGRNEEYSGDLARCATCNATVIAQIDCREPADANTVCATCGMTLVDPPFEGSDYFDVIMRVGRPLGRAK